jgi:outer membrane protein TolC
MKNRFWVVSVLLSLAAARVIAAEAPVREITVPEALRLAEANSPELKAALDRERAAEADIKILKSYYYPRFDLEAIDSYGFPGSSRDLGISGLMSSAFRSGPAAGMTGNLDIFDWGRKYAVEAAKSDLAAVQEQVSIVRYKVDQEALEIYMDGSRFRGEVEASSEVVKETDIIAKEVERFVKTGQRSVVERLLVEDQATEARMAQAAYYEEYQVALSRLALLTGLQAASIRLPLPTTLSEEGLDMKPSGEASPLVAKAVAEAASAHAAVSEFSAQNLPKIQATASVGDMDKSRLVEKKDYSGGFGVTLPLFEGYRISNQVHRAEAVASQRDNDLLAIRMELGDLNGRYDQTINASRVKLKYLTDELTVARRALQLAKERYFSYQGALVDLREALRNFARVESDINEVKTDLLFALGSKAVLNGARVTS